MVKFGIDRCDFLNIKMFVPNFNKSQLIDRLKYSMKKSEVLQLAKSFSQLGITPDELINLSMSADNGTSFHSAWVLENMLTLNLEALDYYLPNLIETLPRAKNASVKRHLTKLIAIGIRRVVFKKVSKLFEREFWATNLEPLEELCFKWFVDEKSKPAVKVYCMEILFLLSSREKWIAEELPHLIENQMTYGSPAFKARGKSLLTLLKVRK